MKVQLSSTDRQVQTLCQEMFSDILLQGWTLHIPNGRAPEIDADLYIWDVEPGQHVRFDVPPPERWRHFYLVDRHDVQRFCEVLRNGDANVILKPVTRAALAAFLTDACARCGAESPASGDDRVESLRADRDAILQCLMQTNLKLQEYDHDRTNFLARAIHDFRAPLTAITGYCGLLLSNDLGSLTEEQREVLGRMQRSAKKLSRMASAMFQLSIAPRVQLGSQCEAGDIRECIEHALHEIVPTTEEKRITVSVETAASPAALYFEQTKLEQVIVNLLENACRFAPRGGSIDVRGYPWYWDGGGGRHRASQESGVRPGDPAPNSYRVDIRDSGPGIPPAQLPKIFEEYTSYAGGTDRSGGGLGLAICRMILNHHDGKIWAESGAEGAVFSFVLPFRSQESLPSAYPKLHHAALSGV